MLSGLLFHAGLGSVVAVCVVECRGCLSGEILVQFLQESLIFGFRVG
jgi:hypothetical protein